MESVKETARAVTSKPVQRAVVNAVLLTVGAGILLCLAAVASALFFQTHVPYEFVKTPIHLQYGHSSNPYGITSLPSALLKSQQDYDISITLSLPRSPANTERGNFMISLYMLGPSDADNTPSHARKFATGQLDIEEQNVVFHSRRPTLVPYVDPILSLAQRLVLLLYHMLVPSAQACTVTVPLAERVSFARDASVPSSAYVEVEAGQGIQIYSVALTMTARLRGLRWLMFHYRLPSFLALTTLFWVCEFAFMSVAWAGFSSVLSSREGNLPAIKEEEENYEEDELSDSEEYERRRSVKEEEEEEEPKREEEFERSLSEIPMAGAEADDEDEEPREVLVGGSRGEGGSGGLRRRTSRSVLE